MRLDRDTIVIYVGDNGTPMYGRPQLDFIDNLYITRTGRGKGTAYESGARVPLAIRGPGIGENRAERRHRAGRGPVSDHSLRSRDCTPPTRVANGAMAAASWPSTASRCCRYCTARRNRCAIRTGATC